MNASFVSIEKLLEKIEVFEKQCVPHEITKGFSGDQKFKVEFPSNEPLLLRVMPLDKCGRKNLEFSMIQRFHNGGVMVPKPIAQGEFPDLELCYYVVSYIEGQDAEDTLEAYTPGVQYKVGFKAGEELRQMHGYDAPGNSGLVG